MATPPVSTVLCELERRATERRLAAAGRATAAEGEAGEAAAATAFPSDPLDGDDYERAVAAALVACEAAGSSDRFKLIETTHGGFLLVTNALPKHGVSVRATGSPGSSPLGDGVAAAAAAAEERGAYDGRRLFEALATLDEGAAEEARGADGLGVAPRGEDGLGGHRDYALRTLTHGAYEGRALSGSYVVYTRQHLERSLSLDKRDLVDSLLTCVETPGLVAHWNVADFEALCWLLFCGPRSFCESDRCFGRDLARDDVPFPALLPPILYEEVTDHATYVDLAELYVHSWYRDYAPEAFERGPVTPGVAGARLAATLRSVKERFHESEVPVWSAASRMCILCTLYNQNRLCLNFARDGAAGTVYSPVLLRDCPFTNTNVTLSHVLPGQRTVSLFPVYDIGALLGALRHSGREKVSLAY